ncbi:sugar kinase [Bacillus alkalicellulosilyticus]|uniref:sugar kinase n=1 Tax=Alkalihalobacterium alkalicellulosilyticum TaxID=1912214 RepID=UPI00148223BF|nr:sugar kinase [Bacillus alkalicellulosilyticus]
MDVVTIGETRALFSPEPSSTRPYSHTYLRTFDGTESNVAIALAKLGHQVGWISKVGNDGLGKALLSFVKDQGVDISRVQTSMYGSTGFCFREIDNGNEYQLDEDRRETAASELELSDIDSDYLAKAKFLYVTTDLMICTNITMQTIKQAITIAKLNHVQIVLDIALAHNLVENEYAIQVVDQLIPFVDIILCNVQEDNIVLGEQDPMKVGKLLISKGPSLAIVNVAEHGAYYINERHQQFIENQSKVKSREGFAAGILSGLIEEQSLDCVIQRGFALGTLLNTSLENERYPSLEEVNNDLKKEEYNE